MEETLIDERAGSDTDQQTVVFRLANESYGIEIFRVNEIIRLPEITPIPRTDSHIKGLVNLRGKTIPVVDLRTRFAMTESAETDSTRIIVVESEHGNIGVIVDAVTEVMTLNHDELEDAPLIVADTNTDFVRSIAKHNNQLITLLDLDKALAA